MSRTIQSLSDEYETPQEVFDYLCNEYKIKPDTDIAATLENSKCVWCLDKTINALNVDWKYNPKIKSVWCNPPYSQTKAFVEKAHEQWLKHNINIMMLIPTRSMKMKYWHDIIESNNIEYHPIQGGICFLVNGEPYRDKKGRKCTSPHAFVVVIWRRH